jgi:hypothetical protein
MQPQSMLEGESKSAEVCDQAGECVLNALPALPVQDLGGLKHSPQNRPDGYMTRAAGTV